MSTQMKPEDVEHHCPRCGERLNVAKGVWLELNFTNTRYFVDGMVPPEESQGSFLFGKACAAAVLKAGGHNKPIRRSEWALTR
jgi:hypothetical protein